MAPPTKNIRLTGGPYAGMRTSHRDAPPLELCLAHPTIPSLKANRKATSRRTVCVYSLCYSASKNRYSYTYTEDRVVPYKQRRLPGRPAIVIHD